MLAGSRISSEPDQSSAGRWTTLDPNQGAQGATTCTDKESPLWIYGSSEAQIQSPTTASTTSCTRDGSSHLMPGKRPLCLCTTG